MSDEILASLEAPILRRYMGAGMLVALGCLAIYIALVRPPAAPWSLAVLVLGLAALWLSLHFWRQTALRIELTRDELRDSAGQRIARVEDIETVDRGAFALKPSNGFLLATRTPGPRFWRPGLWWRLGRRVGVGGITPGPQTKAMADILAALVAERDQDSQTT